MVVSPGLFVRYGTLSSYTPQKQYDTYRMASPNAAALSFSFKADSTAFLAFFVFFLVFLVIFFLDAFLEVDADVDDDPPRGIDKTSEWWCLKNAVR
jgi:hypothetical protein